MGTIIKLTKKQHIEACKGLIAAWNGKDDKFIYEGCIYTEDDIHDAEEALERLTNNNKKI